MSNFFPEPETAPLDFGLPFTQKYQPKRISDFVGLGKPKAVLAAILKSPRPCSLLFVGPPGTGKTTIAAAFAKELGAGMIHIASQSLTVDLVEKTWERVHYFPGTKSDWWVVQVDEAETMSYAARSTFPLGFDG